MTAAAKKPTPVRKSLQVKAPLFTSQVVGFVKDLSEAEGLLQRKAESLLGADADREGPIKVSHYESVGGLKLKVEARFVGNG